jgi:hypothetical protein
MGNPHARLHSLGEGHRSRVFASGFDKQVMGLLIVYSTIAAALLGYVFGAYGSPHRITGLVLFTLLSMTLVLIIDLDRPQGGGVRVSQQTMRDVIAQTVPADATPAAGSQP